MHDNLINAMSAMARRAQTVFGVLAGIVLGAGIELLKWSRDNHRRWNRKFVRLQTDIDRVKKMLGLTTSSTTVISLNPPQPVGIGATVDIASGGTHYFGAIASATAAAAGGIPVGPLARSLTDFYFHVSAALDSATTLTVTPEYSTDQSTWSQLGNQTLALSPSTGLTINQKLKTDSSTFSLPAGAYVRFKAVATGDISSLSYGFWVG